MFMQCLKWSCIFYLFHPFAWPCWPGSRSLCIHCTPRLEQTNNHSNKQTQKQRNTENKETKKNEQATKPGIKVVYNIFLEYGRGGTFEKVGAFLKAQIVTPKGGNPTSKETTTNLRSKTKSKVKISEYMFLI